MQGLGRVTLSCPLATQVHTTGGMCHSSWACQVLRIQPKYAKNGPHDTLPVSLHWDTKKNRWIAKVSFIKGGKTQQLTEPRRYIKSAVSDCITAVSACCIAAVSMRNCFQRRVLDGTVSSLYPCCIPAVSESYAFAVLQSVVTIYPPSSAVGITTEAPLAGSGHS